MIDVNEKLFIKLFIKRESQDRLLYESESQKKRSKFFSRFAYNCIDVLDKSTVVLVSERLTFQMLEDLFFKVKINQPQYGTIFALYESNQKIPYDRTMDYLNETYTECIIFFDNGCAIVKEENEIGASTKYVLFHSER